MAEPPFRSVAIVGLGLIGGSIAFGLRRRWPDLPVIGVDVPAVAAAAHQAEAITDVRERLADLRQVDLVVLATPVPAIVELVGEAGRAGLTGLVTDVGSTKRRIMEAASTSGVRFVGGHPMAGAARGGFSQARADLLHGREWLLVPAPGRADADQDVAGLERLARGLGAVPRRLTADAHDRVMAYVSHLPQLLASVTLDDLHAAARRSLDPEHATIAVAGPYQG